MKMFHKTQTRSTSLTFTGTHAVISAILGEDFLAVIITAGSHIVARDGTRVSARVSTRVDTRIENRFHTRSHTRSHTRFDNRFHTRSHTRLHTRVHKRSHTRLHARVHTRFTVHRHVALSPAMVKLPEFDAWETADVAEVVELAILKDRHAVRCRKRKNESDIVI